METEEREVEIEERERERREVETEERRERERRERDRGERGGLVRSLLLLLLRCTSPHFISLAVHLSDFIS